MMMNPEMAPSSLRGMRVLVVEDSYLAAASLKRLLGSMGCEVLGPAPSVSEALKLVAERGCDAAILDINLGAETAEPVAAELERLGRPYLFVTGYNSPRLLGEPYRHRRRVLKPVELGVLQRAMEEEFAAE